MAISIPSRMTSTPLMGSSIQGPARMARWKPASVDPRRLDRHIWSADACGDCSLVDVAVDSCGVAGDGFGNWMVLSCRMA
mmetsp:Transcript_39328/g.39832  ORF Transcript_39328/g.39832 Transcript_39328/m.39832 type:complete len:80 (-) Transcript_39328:120-359(-)